MKKNSDININVMPQGWGEKTPWHIKAAKWYVKSIVNASLSNIFKVFFVTFFFLATFLGAYYLYRVIGNNDLLERTTERIIAEEKEKAEKEKLESDGVRDWVVTPKIQHDIEMLLYSVNADRVFIFELHNGKVNASGLPFRCADMSYEEVNGERRPDKVAMKYQEVPLTLYKYPEYLHKEKIFIGTIDEIEKVDYDFAQCIRTDGGKYLAMAYLNLEGVPLGFIGLSYHDMKNVPDREVIERKLTEYVRIISELLDLQSQLLKLRK